MSILAVNVKIRHQITQTESTGTDIGIYAKMDVYGNPLPFVCADVIIIGHNQSGRFLYAHSLIRNVQHYARFGIQRKRNLSYTDSRAFQYDRRSQIKITGLVIIVINRPI